VERSAPFSTKTTSPPLPPSDRIVPRVVMSSGLIQKSIVSGPVGSVKLEPALAKT